jgi:hypothetical protein
MTRREIDALQMAIKAAERAVRLDRAGETIHPAWDDLIVVLSALSETPDAIDGATHPDDNAGSDPRDALIDALVAARINLPLGTMADLAERGVRTVEQLAAMTDAQLLDVLHIGPVRLVKLRADLDRWSRVRLGFGTADQYERFLHGLLSSEEIEKR